MTGIQTFVLVVILMGQGVVTVPGYGSIAECEKAAEVVKRNVSSRPFCIPGPVEVK